MSDTNAWICTVCGYIHQGDDPPAYCPLCGADKRDFKPYAAAPSTHADAPPIKGWRCMPCHYQTDRPKAPEECPVCGALSDQFEPVHDTVTDTASDGGPIRVVIIGGGVAGVYAAETVREMSSQAAITIVSPETDLPYYRLNLTRYLAGEIGRPSLPIHPPEWYREREITLIQGIPADQLDPRASAVRLVDGTVLSYERLILATGSHPYVPPLQGADIPGVMTLRTATDADRLITAAIEDGTPCVCIGGGVLGIEIAGALASRGADITLLESHAWLMPRQLNAPAAAVLERHMTAMGVKIIKTARTAAIEGGDRVREVRLQDGRRIPAGGVIIATGVRPNTALARKAGIEVNHGVVVDNHMRTSMEQVYAAGDTAEHNGQVYGSWAASQFQGSIAAMNAIGKPTLFGGLPRANTIKALGIDITSIGNIRPEDGSYIVLEDAPSDGHTYTGFIMRDGRMDGAILIGNAALASAARRAVEERADFSRTQHAMDTVLQTLAERYP